MCDDMSEHWYAHKFGGSSLANAKRIASVGQILLHRKDPAQVVVVSAMQGVTNALLALAQSYSAAALATILSKHLEAAQTLLASDQTLFDTYQAAIEKDASDIRQTLDVAAMLGQAQSIASDWLSGLGEVWSARLLSAHLQCIGAEALFVDAREILRVSHNDMGVVVDWEASSAALALLRQKNPQAKRLIVTGFIARDQQGRICTLGRNGSDYSGAIFGALFEAKEIHIWTDVDGVLSADPRFVPGAIVLPRMSYAEAFELAYFGAKVIHPQTMQPATARGIPLIIRNTLNPEHPGTLIDAHGAANPPIKGVTIIGEQAIVEVEGAGMIGVPGTAERVFAAMRSAGISVVMISQGSSEHSICLVVKQSDAGNAGTILTDAFAAEIARGAIAGIHVQTAIAVLALVGDGMSGTPGVAARLFQSLGRAGVNVRAIAQGASERNISVAIEQAQAVRALRAVHAGVYLSAQTLSIAVIGPGGVGRAVLKQIAAARHALLQQMNIDLRVRAIANSKQMWLSEDVYLQDDGSVAGANAEPLNHERLQQHLRAEHIPHALLIDTSAASDVADHYADWLQRGIHVVTANKQAGSGLLPRYSAIQAAMREGSAKFRYEATVGAGLPIISTLRDALDTGDQVEKVEGIFSGTLAYLFNRFDGSVPFSALVTQAREMGFTEPDPRDDLSGLDVARKLVILARELGWSLALEDVTVESLVPIDLRGAGVEEFLQRLPEFDAQQQQLLEQAKRQNAVLRYVAQLDVAARQARVKLCTLAADHPFAHIRATDNIVQFTTRRYAKNPLIVQGPGAGYEVTAAGVFADVLRIAQSVGGA
jgi:bifunctional aspartokinase / homoserine dehydrogenase 1